MIMFNKKTLTGSYELFTLCTLYYVIREKTWNS